MGLNQALSTALAGLRANQTGLSIVAGNVANIETPGYTRKTAIRVPVIAGDSASVAIAGVNRQLDQFVQDQLQTEMSGAAFARTSADILSSLQAVYGDPGSTNTIEAAFNRFTTALQTLSTSPESQSARASVLSAARSLAQGLNSVTEGIQALRSNAESSLNDSVLVANNAMTELAKINTQLQSSRSQDASTAELLDQRDRLVTQLSELMDIRVVFNSSNGATVFTKSGVQLVDGNEAGRFSFNPQGTVTSTTLWKSDPALSNLGTITFEFAGGGSIDMVATEGFRSGKIAALLDMRDNKLVQAQDQIDELAAAMSSALSDKTTNGVGVTVGPQKGFDLDLTGLKAGNVIHIPYTDTATGIKHNLSIVRVDDPSVLPLSNAVTNDPNDEVIGIDFSGTMADVVAQLNVAVGGILEFSNTGSTLRVLDGGGVNSFIDLAPSAPPASTTITQSSLTSGNLQIPLFTDGSSLYTGALTASGPQQRGLAGRINVNPAVLADASRLIVFSTTPPTPSGDTKRADFILSQMTKGTYFYSPRTGVGSSGSPFKGTLMNFTQQFNNIQAAAADDAERVSEGQEVILNTLQGKMKKSEVNMDAEMALLLELQNAYSANARVMNTVNDLFDKLLQIV